MFILYKGIRVRLSDLNFIKIQGFTICGTCDLCGKAIFLFLSQQNGDYGCPRCKQKSDRVNKVALYPFDDNSELRTTKDTKKIADKVVKDPIEGVKGRSYLQKIAYNYIENTACDIMHIIINLGKRLNSIWFDSQFHDHEASLRQHLNLVNERMNALRPPDFVPRKPRTVDNSGYWKASEIKWFLLAFSLVLLHDIMKDKYFQHHMLLVNGLWILLSQSISKEDLQEAKICLSEYVKRFENLYGKSHMTCNLHQLLHLIETVIRFAPLFITSCFPFENLNFILKNLVKGSKHPELQIVSSFTQFSKFISFKNNFITPNKEVLTFCDNVINRSKRKRKILKIESKLYIVGTFKKLCITDYDVIEAFGPLYKHNDEALKFRRVLYNSILYETHSYCEKKLTNSSCVIYTKNNEKRVGIIQLFVKINSKENNQIKTYAIIKQCVSLNSFYCNFSKSYVRTTFLCKELKNLKPIAIEIQNIKSVCFHIIINDLMFVVEPCNVIKME